MKLGVLFSGGKDSCYALHLAMRKGHEIVCLISVVSENPESYMFHTPGIELTKMQAECAGIPMIQKATRGVKEAELSDLRDAMRQAKDRFGIKGIVTGALESVYQSSRIQRICDELSLWCFNPLWLKDQRELLEEITVKGFKVMITGVFAYPLDKSWLGKTIDSGVVERLLALRDKYQISPAGEGGEIETTVLDAPFFKKRLDVSDYDIDYEENSGRLLIRKAEVRDK